MNIIPLKYLQDLNKSLVSYNISSNLTPIINTNNKIIRAANKLSYIMKGGTVEEIRDYIGQTKETIEQIITVCDDQKCNHADYRGVLRALLINIKGLLDYFSDAKLLELQTQIKELSNIVETNNNGINAA